MTTSSPEVPHTIMSSSKDELLPMNFMQQRDKKLKSESESQWSKSKQHFTNTIGVFRIIPET